MAKKTVSRKALKAFVRKHAQEYLRQDNVTSIGIGYKIRKKKKTKDLCVQFTVGRKIAKLEGLEKLEGVDEKPLPPFVEIEGVKVPTDVLERSFDATLRVVGLEAKLQAASPRKVAVDPIVPGVSIGHEDISAGTAGCVVYDAVNGAPYVLSNWHVLSGEDGKIGDPIVQPGKHDDNRVKRNTVGRLVRSHLGVAGDCAVAAVEHRQLCPDILDLDVAVQRIGEPDLGDRVVKSGRTTAVTYGIVQRTDVIARLHYGNKVGNKEIGCFEIGPDPRRPAGRGEISMGGDSGSAWLAVDRRPTDVMVGLHFAGEVGDAPEHALACYAPSVFEKLGIRPTAPEEVIVEPEAGPGYAADFVGTPILAPTPDTREVREDLLDVRGRTVFHYTHFSLAMSQAHRFARWVAWNIDGGSIRRLSRSGIRFRKDPNLPARTQIGNELYRNNPLDRGHLARRADLVWGTLAEARRANVDSFFYTNITPQHEAFNQSRASGIWGELENAIFDDVDLEDLRVSVMGGPIFSDHDPVYRGIALPQQFWKAIYFREAGRQEITVRGYVLTQADLLNRLEVLELPEFSVFEVPVTQISEMTGLALFSGAAAAAARGRRRRREAVEVVETRLVSSIREIVR